MDKFNSVRYDQEYVDLEDRNSSYSLIIGFVGENKIVLDVGTSTGYIAKILKEQNNQVIGIEKDKEAGEIAKSYCKLMIIEDVEKIDLDEYLNPSSIDVVILGDILEHLLFPERIIISIKRFLKPEGYLVVSLPNICHGDVLLKMMKGDFGYTPTGLLDITHLRFFGRKNIYNIFNKCGYLITDFFTVIKPLGYTEQKPDLAKVPEEVIDLIKALPDSEVYQFVFKAISLERPSNQQIQVLDLNQILGPPIKKITHEQDSKIYVLHDYLCQANDRALGLYQEIGRLRQILSDQDNRIADLLGQLHQANTITNDYGSKIDQLNMDINAITNNCGSKINQLNMEINTITNDCGSKIDQLNMDINTITNDCGSKIDQLNMDILEKNNQITELINRNHQTTEELLAMQKSIVWQMMMKFHNGFVERALPQNSARRIYYDRCLKGARARVNDDYHGTFRESPQKKSDAQISLNEVPTTEPAAILTTEPSKAKAQIEDSNIEILLKLDALMAKSVTMEKALAAKDIEITALKEAENVRQKAARDKSIMIEKALAAKDIEITALKEAENVRQKAAKEQIEAAAKAGLLALMNQNFFGSYSQRSAEYVPLSQDFITLEKEDIKLIAFYLPQFHPIPENDEWWGKGFTEWTNVSKAMPRFVWHYQPHLPGELGFYDLRLVEIQYRQIELARQYGIYGFCFHYYWFNGKRLLDRPLDQFLKSPELNFPFCICWANENWTRRWDGSDKEVLIPQIYSAENDINFIKDVEKLFRDPRYIRIKNRPLIIIYRVQELPNPKLTIQIWRDYCKTQGNGDPYIIAAQTFGFEDPRIYGLDAAVEFPPHFMKGCKEITHKVNLINRGLDELVIDFDNFVKNKAYLDRVPYKLFKTVMPGWDNTPRKDYGATIYHGANPSNYSEWLSNVAEWTREAHPLEERIIFINAWNEWGEGAHLEPDRRFGYGYLQSTSEVVLSYRKRSCDSPPTEGGGI